MFTLVYGVIAGRLVWFASMSEAHVTKHSVAREAVSTARPDIFDRNGLIIATDVKTPSLFAEPRKLIDVDEATELLTAEIPDLDTRRGPRPALRRSAASPGSSAKSRRSSRRRFTGLAFPASASCTENRRVYPTGPVVSHLLGHVNIDNQGIAGIEKCLDGQGLAALHMAGLRPTVCKIRSSSRVDLRVQYVLRDELAARQGEIQGRSPRPA